MTPTNKALDFTCAKIKQHGKNCPIRRYVFRHHHFYWLDNNKMRVCMNGKRWFFRDVNIPDTSLDKFSDKYKWFDPYNRPYAS